MRRRIPECKKGAPEFMNTYGDMVTLLLCFFVLLFAMSTTDAKKFQSMVESFKGALGVLPGGKTVSPEKVVENSRIQAKGTEFKYKKMAENIDKALNKAAQNLKGKAGQELLKNSEVQITKRGIEISLGNTTLFDTAKSDIKPESYEILKEIAIELKNLPNEIVVEGHTDNIPINIGKYASNWELSTSRATNVLRYILKTDKELNGRISAAGYAETRPKAENNTESGRSINRRVEIVILRSNDEKIQAKIGETNIEGGN